MVSSTIALLLPSLLLLAVRADDCKPVTWSSAKQQGQNGAVPTAGIITRNRVVEQDIISTGKVTPGDVNCRFSMSSGKTPNYYTCMQLATSYGLAIDRFFLLNPTVLPDCSNIVPNSQYCVAGFIEPVRSTDGFCGPLYNNATCIGTDNGQCCNAKTWKCGDAVEDCIDGTCYEGACIGDKVYSTDGTCGIGHGNRLCAGTQGDCCSIDGKCGTGKAFCGLGNCQMGNCTRRATNTTTTGLPSWLTGNTTDGTCGGVNKFTCNVVYGNCCNKNNVCGPLLTDCGEGCQPEWGTCSSFTTTTSSLAMSESVSTLSSAVSLTTSGSAVSRSTSSSTMAISTSISAASSVPSRSSPTTATTTSSTLAFSALPTCGQTCINNMRAQYAALGCSSPDTACLCKNANFGYGVRDCANGACGTAVGATVIAYESALCSGVAVTPAPSQTATTSPATTVTDVAALPTCGLVCFSNMVAQYADLGCSSPDPSCLCSNANFGYGLRDCSNGACTSAADAAAALAYGSAYCASASATAAAM